jgi:hypothetical protein
VSTPPNQRDSDDAPRSGSDTGAQGVPGAAEHADDDFSGDLEQDLDEDLNEDLNEDLDEDLDLSEFEGEGGLEGALSRMRAAERDPLSLGWDEHEEETRVGALAGRRHPYLAVFVALASVALCAWIWPDFRFWLESSPRDVGDAQALFAAPDSDADLQNQLVTVSGTPDVSYAARLRIGGTSYRFVRILEGGDRLFALLPDLEGTRSDEFEGRFTGRAKRLSDVRFFDEVVTYFDNQGVTRTHEVSIEGLVEGLERGVFEVPNSAGAPHRVWLAEIARFNVVVERGEFKLVLGRETWPDDATAQAAVSGLNVPWAQLQAAMANVTDDPNASIKRSYGRRFVVAAPEDARAAMVAKLNADAGVVGESADPKVGVLGVPQRYTYAVRPSAVFAREGGLGLEIDMSGVTTSPGYELSGGTLVERSLDVNERLSLEVADISRVEVEERLSVDPEGTIILVGRSPQDQRMAALMFVVVALVGAFNMIAVAVFVRRRRDLA